MLFRSMLTALDLGTAEWTAIARRVPWQMTRMNLNTFARHCVFGQPGMTELIADRLRDPKAIAKARVFPYQLMTAYTMAVANADIPQIVCNRAALPRLSQKFLRCEGGCEGTSQSLQIALTSSLPRLSCSRQPGMAVTPGLAPSAQTAAAFGRGAFCPACQRRQRIRRFNVAHNTLHWVRTFSSPHTVQRRKPSCCLICPKRRSMISRRCCH